MSKVSDELREWAEVLKRGAYTKVTAEKISAIADRIDREMIELPLAADKKPIKPNQTVYSKLGKEYRVIRVMCNGGWTVHCEPRFGGIAEFVPNSYFSPQDLTHERPDSLERIADELDEWKRKAAEKIPCFGLEEDALHAIADRIRKLAAKEDMDLRELDAIADSMDGGDE